MKKRAYISIIVATTLLLGGCVVDDQEPVRDLTLTAYQTFCDVDNTVCGLVDVTAHALVLGTYMDAENDSERNKIEDTYYKYYKVRDVENLWQVYDRNYSEEYYVADNKSLAQEGASWLVKRCTPVFVTNKFYNSEFTLRRIDAGSYKLFLNKAKIGDISSSYSWLDDDTAMDYSRYTIDAVLDITTDFFAASGQNVDYVSFTVAGTLTMVDSNNPNFVLEVSIPQPISLRESLPDFVSAASSGGMTITIDEAVSKAHETVEVKYLNLSSVSVVYTTADGKYSKTYNYGNYYRY